MGSALLATTWWVPLLGLPLGFQEDWHVDAMAPICPGLSVAAATFGVTGFPGVNGLARDASSGTLYATSITQPTLQPPVSELITILLTDPENFPLLLSSDLGCQIQWFTHSLFEGQDSFAALFALLTAVQASFAAGSLDLGSDLSTMYGQAMCGGMASTSEQFCASTPGCEWTSGACTVDADATASSQDFGELMCFGDGTGEELTGADLTNRVKNLALF